MSKEIYHLSAKDPLNLAREIMQSKNIRHLPIVNKNNNIVGLISDRDILKATITSLAHLSKKQQTDIDRNLKIEDVMSKNILTISPQDNIRLAASMMIENKIGCLPVVEGDQLIGIVSESDFLQLSVYV